MQSQAIPVGECQCGCGHRTNVPRYTNPSKGQVAGQPVKFVRGHQGRKRLLNDWTQFYTETPGPLDTPCWRWAGKVDPNGYANRMALEGKEVEAHRAFYEREHGQIPTGLELDHLCRVRACVNPAHLEPVTHAENMRRGANARLTPAKVLEIRRRDAAGEPMRRIAAAFDVSYDTIRNIVRRKKAWRDVV